MVAPQPFTLAFELAAWASFSGGMLSFLVDAYRAASQHFPIFWATHFGNAYYYNNLIATTGLCHYWIFLLAISSDKGMKEILCWQLHALLFWFTELIRLIYAALVSWQTTGILLDLDLLLLMCTFIVSYLGYDV